MLTRPGRTKQAIAIPLAPGSRDQDLRATLEFSRVRHEVMSLLRDGLRQAEILERERLLAADAAA
jgi:hypothetical protein